MKLIEKLYKRRKLYKGKSIDFSNDIIILPNGKKATREYTDHPGAVTVLPFVDKKNIVLVRQYRYPVKSLTYELPAGKLNKGENPLLCVKRELVEETGYKTGHIKEMCTFWPAPAFSTELMHIYVAKNLKQIGNCPDDDEFLDRKIVTFDTALKWVREGKIRDSKSIIGILMYYCFHKEK